MASWTFRSSVLTSGDRNGVNFPISNSKMISDQINEIVQFWKQKIKNWQPASEYVQRFQDVFRLHDLDLKMDTERALERLFPFGLNIHVEIVTVPPSADPVFHIARCLLPNSADKIEAAGQTRREAVYELSLKALRLALGPDFDEYCKICDAFRSVAVADAEKLKRCLYSTVSSISKDVTASAKANEGLEDCSPPFAPYQSRRRYFDASILSWGPESWTCLPRTERENILFGFWLSTSRNEFPRTFNLLGEKLATTSNCLGAFMLLFSRDKTTSKETVRWTTTRDTRPFHVNCRWIDGNGMEYYVNGTGMSLDCARNDAARSALRVILGELDFQVLGHATRPFFYKEIDVAALKARLDALPVSGELSLTEANEFPLLTPTSPKQSHQSISSARQGGIRVEGTVSSNQGRSSSDGAVLRSSKPERQSEKSKCDSGGPGHPATTVPTSLQMVGTQTAHTPAKPTPVELFSSRNNVVVCKPIKRGSLPVRKSGGGKSHDPTLNPDSLCLREQSLVLEPEKDGQPMGPPVPVGNRANQHSQHRKNHVSIQRHHPMEEPETPIETAVRDQIAPATVARTREMSSDASTLPAAKNSQPNQRPTNSNSGMGDPRVRKPARQRVIVEKHGNQSSTQLRKDASSIRRDVSVEELERPVVTAVNDEVTLAIPAGIRSHSNRDSTFPCTSNDRSNQMPNDSTNSLRKEPEVHKPAHLSFDDIIGYWFPDEASEALELLFEGREEHGPQYETTKYVISEFHVGAQTFRALGATAEEAKEKAAAEALKVLGFE